VCGRVADVGPRAEESLALPIGDDFRAGSGSGFGEPAAGDDTDDIFRKGEPEAGGLGGQLPDLAEGRW
jgi:hypothetical protein